MSQNTCLRCLQGRSKALALSRSKNKENVKIYEVITAQIKNPETLYTVLYISTSLRPFWHTIFSTRTCMARRGTQRLTLCSRDTSKNINNRGIGTMLWTREISDTIRPSPPPLPSTFAQPPSPPKTGGVMNFFVFLHGRGTS